MLWRKYYTAQNGNLNEIINLCHRDGYRYHVVTVKGTHNVLPIKLLSRLTLNLDIDSVISARRGCYRAPNPKRSWRGDCVLTAYGVSSVKIIGKGIITMSDLYIDGNNQARHAIRIENSKNIYISGPRIKSAQADCIWVGTSGFSDNIQLRNLICEYAQRNCITVSNGSVYVKDVECRFAKRSGFDIETEAEGNKVKVRAYDLRCFGNKYDGLQIDCGKSKEYYDLYFRNYQSDDNGRRNVTCNNFHPLHGAGRLVFVND